MHHEAVQIHTVTVYPHPLLCFQNQQKRYVCRLLDLSETLMHMSQRKNLHGQQAKGAGTNQQAGASVINKQLPKLSNFQRAILLHRDHAASISKRASVGRSAQHTADAGCGADAEGMFDESPVTALPAVQG